MNKNRYLLIFAVAFCLNFSLNNISFAIQDVVIKSRYPDYSYEFNGKDTCEKFNRKLFILGLKLNKYILRPVNIAWASVVPKYGMDRLKNAYNNINFPTRFVGCLLQKDFKSSKQEAVRFLTNTTLGVGGLYDPALTRFKIEPCQEDMAQVLAHYNVKKGPYIVLAFVRGNLSDLVGKLLDCPLNPVSYAGPFGAAANAVLAVNNTTYMQPIFKKIDDNYADPYELTKKIDGIDRYIKNSNLDRKAVFAEKTAPENIIKVSKLSEEYTITPDVELTNFNSQGPLIDSMRTALFDNQKIDSSKWADVSLWNRCFDKKIKTSSINVYPGRDNYKFRYILQKNKNSPVAILYPSISDGIRSDKSLALAKILYDEGYSVVIQGSSFQWEFVKSMPNGYTPGIPAQDAQYLRTTTSKILENLQIKNGCKFDKKILVGCSFGALTGLFAAAQEEKDQDSGKNTIGISNYIVINPPIEIFFALKQIDKYTLDCANNPSDIKLRAAIAVEKAVQVSKKIYHKDIKDMPESLPFNEDDFKIVISAIMKQTLSDVVFTIENCSRAKKSNIYEAINNMSFNDYSKKYLSIDTEDSYQQINCGTSLYAITDFLKTSKKYKIYHSLDDYFVNQKQIAWLKQQTDTKSVIFSNGSHLGVLYRKEFLDQFKKDISLQTVTAESEIEPNTTKDVSIKSSDFLTVAKN